MKENKVYVDSLNKNKKQLKNLLILLIITVIVFVISCVLNKSLGFDENNPRTIDYIILATAIISALGLIAEPIICVVLIAEIIHGKLEKNKLLKCQNCHRKINFENDFCSFCGMPYPETLEKVSAIMITFAKLFCQNVIDNKFENDFEIFKYSFSTIINIKDYCSESSLKMEPAKNYLINAIGKECYDDFKRIYIATPIYANLYKKKEKQDKKIKSLYEKGKITSYKYSQYQKEIGTILNDNINNVALKSLPEEIFNQFMEIAYKPHVSSDMLFDEEMQIIIRDKIEMESKKVSKNIMDLHNSELLQKREYDLFVNRIEKYTDLYNDVTLDFIEDLLMKMRNKAKIVVVKESNDVEPSNISSFDELDELDGWAFEEWCANVLKANGFINVEVTPKSGDNGADILAEKDDVTYSIQCKKYQSPVGVSAIQEVNTSKGMYNKDIAVVMTNSTFTPQAIKLAQSVNVKLWDGKRLKEMAKKRYEDIV